MNRDALRAGFWAVVFTLGLAVIVLTMAIVGGINTITGAIVGAALITVLNETMRRVENGVHIFGLHLNAATGISAADRAVRANALEFLETALKPDLAKLLLPLIDPQVTLERRVQTANRLVGTTIDSVDGAIETLLASEDSWLRQTAHAARARLWQPEQPEPAPEPREAEPAALGAGL
jgi:hypothetical protein